MLILAGPVGEVEHDGGAHPERPARITAVRKGIEDLRIGADAVLVEPAAVARADLERVHSPRYLDELEAFARRGGGALDQDTYVTARSWDVALAAVGAGMAAVQALRDRGEGFGFVVARPPGHHAERTRGMGFCLLNNVAVSAASLAATGQRVLVLDWDVHHGNGTQEIFWDVPDVLYASTHQWPLYPGTGTPSEVGGPGALGATINLPVPPGATGDVLRVALEEVVAPAVGAFQPDWVLVSCGFDAHRADPLAELALSSADFADLARMAAGFAPAPGRLVLFLEGGYDMTAVRRSTAAVVAALLGEPGAPEPSTFGGPGTDAVRAAAEVHLRAVVRAQDQLDQLGGGGLDAPVTGPTARSERRLW